MKPTLYILCGVPFAGKTTLASRLAETRHMHHIQVDAIRRERGIGLAGQLISEAEWEEVFAESYRRMAAALELGEDVVFDATNYSRSVRDHLRMLSDRQGASTAVIFVAIDADTANSRRQQNEAAPQRDHVGDDEFREVVRDFQEPAEDEHVLRYEAGMPLDDWIAYTFR